MKEKIIVFLPAKGNSNRVVGKNLKLLDGKPLFLHTLEKLSELSDIFDTIYIDTDSDEIIEISKNVENVSIMKRDSKFANNKTDGNKLLLNEINYDNTGTIYVQILGTSPFIKKETIIKAINAVLDGADCSFLVKKEQQYSWNQKSIPNYDLKNIPNSNTLEPVMIETMGLYVIRKEVALRTEQRVVANGQMIEATPLEAIDLNHPEDFELANFVSAGLREQKRKLINNLKANLSSPMLSDILDDLNITQKLIIENLKPNLQYTKILGFAKTMKLRKKRPTDKMEDIYKALDSYEKIIPGDIILVENEIPEYAYFGELNCNLAIRAGAIGAIIGGKTRDSEAVKSHHFPVFSTGNICKDVRGRAVLDSLSQSIVIDDVVIYEGDLIFGDNEGVIVIPKKYIEIVIAESLKRIKSEKEIIFDITKGENINNITEKYGFF